MKPIYKCTSFPSCFCTVHGPTDSFLNEVPGRPDLCEIEAWNGTRTIIYRLEKINVRHENNMLTLFNYGRREKYKSPNYQIMTDGKIMYR